MKKESARAARAHRRHARNTKGAALSLTSLMDIFTILVFFLLVNSDNSQKPPEHKEIVLPDSIAEKIPEQTLKILVGGDDIIVEGIKVASISAAMAQEDDIIGPLKEELDYRAARSVPTLDEDGNPVREITIMAHREIPYKLLHRVMLTCGAADYSKMSFAVLQKGQKEGS